MSKRITSLILSIVMILLIIQPASFSAFAADFETELKNKGFPDTYIPALLALHNAHPNWSFEALNVGENFSTAVSNERKPHSQQLIQKYSGNDGKGYYCTCSSCYVNGNYVIREGSTWVAASQSAVEFYLDPRNFLNEEYIFQFESTAYNSAHTQAGVENILNGTWMHNANITYKNKSGSTVTYKDGNGNAVKYSKAIMNAAKNSNMSAYYLASKIVQEVGGASATAGGASGTYSGYPGIYNYYNINASSGAADGLRWASVAPNAWVTTGDVNLRQGSSTSTTSLVVLPKNQTVTYISTTAKQSDGYTWVKVSVTYGGKSYTGYIRSDYVEHKGSTVDYNRPWTNPYLSIYNGAKWIANNFGTQYTGYLQKFNVNPASTNKHSHEYMANVQAAASEASIAYRAYKDANLLDSAMAFTIPVYSNMPATTLEVGLETPVISSVTSTSTGIKIAWDKVTGAAKYRVYYKTDSGSWTKLTDTASTSYTWTDAVSNTNYAFTIRCISNDGKTYLSTYDSKGKSIHYIAAPAITAVTANNSGTVIEWGKVDGASKYRVLYKNSSGDWVKIADTASTKYTWSDAKSGTNYTITVRCLDSDGAYIGGYNSTGVTLKALAAPVISSVAKAATGIEVKWGKVTGAEKYRVFYKTGSGNWTKAGDTTSTSFTWTGAKSNTTYSITVRCITSDGVYTSGYDTVGKSIKYIAAPKISSVSNVVAGVKISWGKVAGAEKYRVFYKNSNGNWVTIADTTSTSYTWTKAKNNTKYTFTVRSMDKNGNYISSYDATGKSITFMSAPKVSVSNVVAGVKVSWGKVTGAVNYKVYRKTPNGSYKALGTTTSTSFVDKTAKNNTKYIYAVRCVTKDGKTTTSSYNPGKSKTFMSAPTVSVSNVVAGVKVSWKKVSGASNYVVFRKTPGGTYKKIGTTTGTSFVDKTAKSGTKYIYTVRCATKDGKTYTSSYNAGKSKTFVSAPTFTVSKTSSGVQIKWSKVTGASNYAVFRKTANGTYKKIGTTTGTSFVDKTAKKGTKYIYTVRCASKDGKSYTSSYNAGKSITR